MFKLIPNPTFDAPVAITVPGAETPATLAVTWRHKGRKALAEWLRGAGPGAGAGAGATVGADAAPTDGATAAQPGTSDAAWLGQVIAGWAGPQDEAGAPVAYTPGALGALLDAYPAAGGELLAVYLRALTESRAKN